MKDGKYSVLLVEDQTIPTQLFEHFIQSSGRYELARSIDCAAFAEVYCMTGGIDIVLMDVVTADGANGLDAAEKIKKKYPDIKIVIVTSMPECSYINRAKKLGAEGFWYKETGKESLISVMDRVMNGETVYPEGLQIVEIGLAKSNEFTDKELIVLRLMTGGYSNHDGRIQQSGNCRQTGRVTQRGQETHFQYVGQDVLAFAHRTCGSRA